MPRYANTVDNAPRFAGARRLFHAVSDGLYTLVIHSDGQIPSHPRNPVLTCHFPVLRELSVVPLADPSIIPGLDEDVPSEPLFPAVTHLQLGFYAIARWVDHAPRSTHLLVQDLKYWDCPNIVDNLAEVLGFNPADFPPFGKVNTQPAVTHPHLRRVALEMPPAPAHDNSGEDSHLFVGLWFALTRLANYSGYVGFKFTLLDDRKELPTSEERRDRFKTQWLDRIQGGLGCRAETGTLSAGAAAERIFEFACTDGGLTGCSLARTSKAVRAAARTTCFYSVIIDANPQRLQAFLALFTRQRSTSPPESDGPRVRHLYITLPPVPHVALLAPCYDRPRRLLHAVAEDLYTLVIHDYPRPSANPMPTIPIIDRPFPVLRELTVVPLSVPSILADMDIVGPLFPVVTHLHLILSSSTHHAFSISSWLSHAPRSTYLRVPNVNYSCPQNVVEDLRAVLGRVHELPDLNKGTLLIHSQRKPHPHLRRVILRARAPPVPGGVCGEPWAGASVRYEAFTHWLDRLAASPAYDDIKILILKPDGRERTLGEWSQMAKAQWLDRMDGGAGCWEEERVRYAPENAGLEHSIRR
ncbi:hypothetical protein ACG7TL_005756 [Trametes sanguinea]